MEYLYAENINYEDYSSGRVIYGRKGLPNFPIRLGNEIFGRSVRYLAKKDELTVYDPCCGSGYYLTILGLFHSTVINMIYGSDINEEMVQLANKNLSLLHHEGLEKRRIELESLYQTYHKDSHKYALESLERIQKQLGPPVPFETFVSDCTTTLPRLDVDIIITDVPYGNLANWQGDSLTALDMMLEQLYNISDHEMILAISLNKMQKVQSPLWKVMEKHNMGKRKFVILKKF